MQYLWRFFHLHSFFIKKKYIYYLLIFVFVNIVLTCILKRSFLCAKTFIKMLLYYEVPCSLIWEIKWLHFKNMLWLDFFRISVISMVQEMHFKCSFISYFKCSDKDSRCFKPGSSFWVFAYLNTVKTLWNLQLWIRVKEQVVTCQFLLYQLLIISWKVFWIFF